MRDAKQDVRRHGSKCRLTVCQSTLEREFSGLGIVLEGWREGEEGVSGLREGGDRGVGGSTYCCRRRASVRSLRVVCRVHPVRVRVHAILGWTPSCGRRESRRMRAGREDGQASDFT